MKMHHIFFLLIIKFLQWKRDWWMKSAWKDGTLRLHTYITPFPRDSLKSPASNYNCLTVYLSAETLLLLTSGLRLFSSPLITVCGVWGWDYENTQARLHRCHYISPLFPWRHRELQLLVLVWPGWGWAIYTQECGELWQGSAEIWVCLFML